MKCIRPGVLALLTAVILASCDLGGRAKPLMGGIQPRMEEAGTSETASETASGTAGNAPAGDGRMDSLEIPAPLTHVAEQILKRTGYTVSYNKETRLPNWVAWHLTAAHTEGEYKRQHKAFHEDGEVEEPRATDRDYYNSGYDRGHMCPAADNKWSEQAMYESFLFTNMCPQNHNLNSGDWSEMENQCRRWAKEYGDIYIVCGPVLYRGRHKTIGKNKVVVPEAFFKVVLCMNPAPKAIGFIYKNAAGDRPKGDYVNSVDEVERITGIDFFPALPDDVENRIEKEGRWSEWEKLYR